MSKPETPQSLAAYADALRQAYSPTQQDRSHVREAIQRTLMDPRAQPEIEEIASTPPPDLIAQISGAASPLLKQVAALLAAACAGAAIAFTLAPHLQRQETSAAAGQRPSLISPPAAVEPLVPQANTIATPTPQPAASEKPNAEPKPAAVARHRSTHVPQRERAATSTSDETAREDAVGLQGLEPSVPVEPMAQPLSEMPSTLGKELELVRAASHALDRGEPLAALRTLAEHARRFPEGALAIERRGLELIARCTLQPHVKLRSELELFLARFPTAPVAARASRACESAQ